MLKLWALARGPKTNGNAQLLPAWAMLLGNQTPAPAMKRAQNVQLLQRGKELEAALKEKEDTIAALQRTSKASNSAKQLQLAAIVDLNKQLADSKMLVADKDKKLAAAKADLKAAADVYAKTQTAANAAGYLSIQQERDTLA
jgi:hypothetical protein